MWRGVEALLPEYETAAHVGTLRWRNFATIRFSPPGPAGQRDPLQREMDKEKRVFPCLWPLIVGNAWYVYCSALQAHIFFQRPCAAMTFGASNRAGGCYELTIRFIYQRAPKSSFFTATFCSTPYCLLFTSVHCLYTTQ